MMVPGSDLPQTNVIHIRIEDREGKIVADGYLGTLQFMTAMMGGPAAPILLRTYATPGGMKSDPEPQIQPASALLQKLVAENDSDVKNATAALCEAIEAIENGHVKPNKQTLKELRWAAKRIQEHVCGNRDYIVDKVHHAIESKVADAVTNLVGMAASLGLPGAEDQQGQIAGYRQQLLPPVEEGGGSTLMLTTDVAYQPLTMPELNIPDVPLEKMTAADVAKEMYARLKMIENDPVKNRTGDHSLLFWASATASKGGVNVTYISYQGTTFLSLEEAKKYLVGLREGYIGRHFEFFRQT